ncbi:interferon-induced very large GTPase 1-like [Ruditapes philippinarum]|uniref:interferon-induced very large GTPase 1-like n=1 Tax=Ruditapes philippinarum TaxID=129788 RepID=UPI00295B3F6E|nr:interferon-induced very large GTPase 1-like [Ruditapes philippinarum]
MCVHSESRDIRVSESDENDFAVKHNISCCPEIPQENQDISPLDIFTVVFQCCDPVLKQVIVQRLYLCKLAVPFLYRHWEATETQYQALSVWPLRSLIIDNVQRNVNEYDILGSESDALELLSKVLAFGSTYKGAVEQNVVDMLLNVTKYITKQLETTHTKSFEKRFSDTQSTIIKTDEDNEVCQESKLEAKTLIKQMKTESEPNVWKQNLTPVQSKLSRQLGKLLKERERERDFSKGIKLDEKINLLRQTQMHSITKTVKLFLDILIKYENYPLKLEYFLRWLNFDIQREQRQILSKLMHEHQNAWEKLKTLKTAKRWMEDEIKEQETLITEFEDKIDEASFTVQNFFHEIGHINDAILELKEDSTKLGLPMLKKMSDIFGCYVADGHPFELVDGDSFYMPYQWIKSVIKCTGANYVMSVSVLGLQSSGKSTLLNTMFGSEFAVRTGRCTRGINAQLIPLKSEHNDKNSSLVNYVLLIDTEGLRSPELSHVQHEHDNELATVITGVGDITILNIMGENISDIRDVLQVIVHAFLRLKMTNKKLDIKKSCAFIHHNVADPFASKRMTCGLIKLMQTLDEMTEDSARSEGILDIKRFSQVIECDMKTQIWYLQNLLQGNPPMARVNNEYSENVVDIKFKILDKSLKMKNKSFKSLNDVVEQAHNLWKGVLNEDFVFSFRNSIEIKAYMEMEYFVQAELWKLESFVRDKLIQISQNSFATCDKKKEISKRSLEILTVIFQEKQEEALRQRSMIVANDCKGQKLSNETIDQLFTDIWGAFLNKVDTSVTGVIMSKKKMQDVFQTCLENIFKQNHALLKQALEETNFLTPLPNVKQLAKSFCETGINKTDISFKVEVKEEMTDTMNTIIRRVDQIFESVDTKIKELCHIHDEVTEMSVNKLMWELHYSIQDILKTNSGYKFKKSFDVKLCVHVSRHAHPIFEIHNEKYSKTHATAVLLEQYRVQQKISFQYQLQCRKFEDFVAELFSSIIEYFAEKWALQTLPNKVTDELLALLPSVKNRVIIEICKDLLRNDDFENFICYIEDPKKYASIWITEKAYQYLDGQVIVNTSSSLLTELFRSVKKCVQEVQKEYERKSPPSNETWIEYFEHALKSYNHAIPSERFRRIKNEETIIQNFEYLTTKILENMNISEKRLASKFKSLQSHSIKWPDFNPISRVMKQIWGCQEQCPFCGEPCAKSRDHVGSTHYSLQHRPTCCTGSRNFSTNDACLTSCEFHIQSDFKHSCRVFNNICYVENNECDGEHLYSAYKTYLPDWDIAPTSNMYESSKYWIWFVVKYKQQLKRKYGYGIDNIPSSWNNVTISEAIESLNKIFSA